MAAALGFKSGSDDMRVGTDENREGFVLQWVLPRAA